MATKLGQKICWCKFLMMMTYIEVKGQQRSRIVNYALWLYQTWSEEIKLVMTFMEVKDQQRSNNKLCLMATKLGQKNRWCKLRMMTLMEVKGQPRPNMKIMLYGNQTWSEESLMQVQDDNHKWPSCRAFMEVNSDVFLILHKSRVSQSLPYQVSFIVFR